MTFGRRVALAVGAERDERNFILHFVDGGVIFGGAGAVDAAEDPDHRGGGFVFLHAGGQGAFPVRAGDGVLLRAGARGSLAGILEDIGPGVEYGEQVVAVVRIGDAEHVRLFGDIDEGGGVEGICVGGGDILEGGGRIFAKTNELTHGAVCAFGLCHIRENAASVLHRDERIAVNVGIDGELFCFGRGEFGFCCGRRESWGSEYGEEQRQQTGWHQILPSKCAETRRDRGRISRFCGSVLIVRVS